MIALKLPTDYEVRRVKPARDHGRIVLVALTDNRVTPLATYYVAPDGACFHGHYFYNGEEDKAVADWRERR